jgi:hypothetical protein
MPYRFTWAITTATTAATALEPVWIRVRGGSPGREAMVQRLVVSEKAVSKHCTSIFAKLDLPLSEDDNRRVLAVLVYLDS